jgi:hypothetical protein
MVYKANFVVAVKVGGKVLRESGGQVELPFGSEYSILLKNLNSVKAQAQISIDGESAGPWYVLGPNASMEIERFNRTGNQKRGNRFKFIERTEEVEDHRGVQAEDGLIRVEFKFEKKQPVIQHTYHYHHHDSQWPYNGPCWPSRLPYIGDAPNLIKYASPTIQCQNMSAALTRSTAATFNCSTLSTPDVPKEVAGITVEGSESNQSFVTVSDFETEQSEVLTLKLIGKVDEKPVERPVTVDLRAQCKTCGRRAKGDAKFCSGCGTSLHII